MLIKKLLSTLPVCVIAMAIASCSSDDDSTIETHSASITFSPAMGTRTVIQSIDDLQGFSVWAYLNTSQSKNEDVELGTWRDVFAEQPVNVYKSGTWVYDNVENWTRYSKYVFHALYPTKDNLPEGTEIEVVNADDPANRSFSIKDFDATKHNDLIYAYQERDYETEGGSAVSFTFRHLLTKVTFVGKADANLSGDGISVKLTSIKLYGEKLSPKNTCTLSATGWGWNHGTGTTESEPFVTRIDEGTPDQHVTLQPGKDFDLFTETDNNDLLIIPQEDLNGIYFRVGYEYSSNGITTSKGSGIINLGNITNATKSWEAGKSYKYSFIIGASDYIMFNAPTVTQWQPANLGEIVDK